MQFLSLSYHPVHGFVYASEAEGSNTAGHAQAQHQNQHQQQQQQQTDPATQQTQSAMIMSTVPLPSSATLFQHFVYACQPFWCHRHTHAVLGGLVYDVGDFRIRLGDVRQTQPVARVRGTVVEVEWRGPSLVDSIPSSTRTDANRERAPAVATAAGFDGDGDGDDDSGVHMVFDSVVEADVDAEYVATAALIREFWAKLDIEGAREAILVPDIGKEVKNRLHRWKQQVGKGQGNNNRGVNEGENGQSPDEDPDPEAGVDVARQFMEILRFNR